MKISKEIKTALLVIGSLALLIWGIIFLNGRNFFGSNRTYYVLYENVDGLNTASPVTINGLVIGKVNSITLQEKGDLLVELLLTNPVELTKSTKAVMISAGLIGGKQIALDVSYENPEIVPTGGYLIGDYRSGLIDGLGDKADPLVKKLDVLLTSVNNLTASLNNVLNSETQNHLQSIIVELDGTMKNANQLTMKINQMLVHNESQIDDMLTNFNKTSKDLAAFSGELDQLKMDKVQQAMVEFNQAATKLNTMMNDVEKGNGNLGKLLKDEKLYHNIEGASKQLNQLLEDVKLHPSRYLNISVFSKKEQPYVEPKK